MWQIISNISSIITCTLFILYIIGHIWKVFVTKNTRYEKFKVVPFNSDFDIDDTDNVVIIDDIGEEFSISANYAQTECQFRYCGTAIPFLTVRSTAR